MSRKIHRILLALVVVIMGSCFLLSEKEANAYTTKAQIRKSIKKYTYLEKKVKKEAISAKKSYQKYSKQSGKARNGSIVIFMGKIVNSDPCVVYAWNQYFYIQNPERGTRAWGAFTGSIKKTGGYKYINGYTAVCARTVNDPAGGKASKYKAIYDKKAALANSYASIKDKLKRALTYKVSMKSAHVFLGYNGSTADVSPYESYYNKVTWRSSNTAIATVSSKGIVKGKKCGKVTITARTNISKKTTKFKVYVKNRPELKCDLNSSEMEVGTAKEVKILTKGMVRYNDIKYKTSNSKVCGIIDNWPSKSVTFECREEGIADVTIEYRQYIKHIRVKGYKLEASLDTNEVKYTKSDIGVQKTIGFKTNTDDVTVYAAESDKLRIDNVSLPKFGQQSQCVSGTITYTVLKPGDTSLYLKYKSKILIYTPHELSLKLIYDGPYELLKDGQVITSLNYDLADFSANSDSDYIEYLFTENYADSISCDTGVCDVYVDYMHVICIKPRYRGSGTITIRMTGKRGEVKIPVTVEDSSKTDIDDDYYDEDDDW